MPQKIFSLLSKFHSFKKILNAEFKSLLQTEGINKLLASRIISALHNIEAVNDSLSFELDKLKKINGNIITYWDNDYPETLKNIYYPPLIIYTLGSFIYDDRSSIAIVGTREPSTYGKIITEKLTTELVENNITIVSGMARGIDSIAHSTAIKSGGRTIAVIGSGLDIIYPPENKKLFEEIKENGVIISEFSLGTKPDAQNFPRRNRIISGLSIGTLIIETKLNGGAMQTAAYALDQNREIFAIPGNINVKQSEGPNILIQRGEAKLVTSTEDILAELKIRTPGISSKELSIKHIELNFFEEKIFSILNTDAKQIDEIALACSMTTSDCLVNLLTLEFKGLVKQLPGKMFMKC